MSERTSKSFLSILRRSALIVLSATAWVYLGVRWGVVGLLAPPALTLSALLIATLLGGCLNQWVRFDD